MYFVFEPGSHQFLSATAQTTEQVDIVVDKRREDFSDNNEKWDTIANDHVTVRFY